jgi:hypothetical protein
MDRSPFYTGSIWRSYDVGNTLKDVVKAVGRIVAALRGNQSTAISGFSFAQSSPTANMSISLAAGEIFELGAVDPTTFGSLGTDSTVVVLHGHALAQTLTFNTAALVAGQQQWALVQAEFEYVDAIRSDDPTGGVLPFWNAAAPTNPLQGPNGLGTSLPTVRQGLANVDIVYGTPATAGSAVPPAVSTGFVPLYLVLLAFGQLSITNGEVLVAGTTAYGGYQQAPFMSGIENQHHLGLPGTAPKLDVTKEITGQVPLANCLVSNPSPAAVGGHVIVSGEIPIVQQINVNPNGNLAGIVQDRALNLATSTEYVCTTTGSTGTAVWTAVGGASNGPPGQYFNTSPYNITNSYETYFADATTGSLTANMPLVSSVSGGSIEIVLVGFGSGESNTCTITPAGSDKFIYAGTVYTSLVLSELGDSRTMKPCTIPSGAMAGTYWAVT